MGVDDELPLGDEIGRLDSDLFVVVLSQRRNGFAKGHAARERLKVHGKLVEKLQEREQKVVLRCGACVFDPVVKDIQPLPMLDGEARVVARAFDDDDAHRAGVATCLGAHDLNKTGDVVGRDPTILQQQRFELGRQLFCETISSTVASSRLGRGINISILLLDKQLLLLTHGDARLFPLRILAGIAVTASCRARDAWHGLFSFSAGFGISHAANSLCVRGGFFVRHFYTDKRCDMGKRRHTHCRRAVRTLLDGPGVSCVRLSCVQVCVQVV